MTQPPLSRQIRLLEHQVARRSSSARIVVVRFTAAGGHSFPKQDASCD
jgi:DNA-binding transcriptional LysR family regulator